MRRIRCQHCGGLTELAAGHQPENHRCDHCHQPLQRDRAVACAHCATLNAITWDDDPADWTCRTCGYALGQRPIAPRRDRGAGAEVLGGVLGGLAGALVASEGARSKGTAAAGGALLGSALGALIGGLVGSETQAPPRPTATEQASRLADWIRAWYPYGDQLTHLKLQKLAFYSHGIALAHGVERPFADITFEAWEHGPVCRPIWERFRHLGNRPLDAVSGAPSLPPEPSQLLYDVLTIYGALDAWRLRQQTHLEPPWQAAFSQRQAYIDRALTRSHFHRLYLEGPVEPPAYLFDGGSFWVDGIPVQRYPSLAALAEALRR